jgi:hypothetical protein
MDALRKRDGIGRSTQQTITRCLQQRTSPRASGEVLALQSRAAIDRFASAAASSARPMRPSFSDDGKWTPNRRIAISIIGTVALARSEGSPLLSLRRWNLLKVLDNQAVTHLSQLLAA